MVLDAVIFDWGGTLTPWHTIDPADSWRAYAGAYDPAHGPEVAGKLSDAEDQAWLRSRDEHRSTSFEAIVRAAGLEPSGEAHQRGVEAYRAWWEPHTYTDPDVVPLLTALRDRAIRVGVLSNTVWPRDDHELVFARDGVLHLIDGAIYTSEIDYTKPHPEAFAAAMSAVGADRPERCVYVGDRLFDDIHGAHGAGMKAVFVPHSEIPAVQRGHTDGEPDAVLDRLADLLPLVDSWTSGRA
jgi:putative hydrolase of the HAD superfamily